MLGFQTQTQSDMAIKHVDKDIMLMDATFGTNQREMALYTALGIDNFGNGVPVFHVLTHGSSQDRLDLMFEAFQAYMQAKCPAFRPSCMMVDDAMAEINAIK